MTESTFAGKSTDDTIRNYAEMLIDDLNSNLPDNASKHWDKAREIDNQMAKEIFGGETTIHTGKGQESYLLLPIIPRRRGKPVKHDGSDASVASR